MSRRVFPLGVCLDELRALRDEEASGTFYLTCSDNDVAAIALGNGVVESVSFRGRHGDFAVELLKSIDAASHSFVAEPPWTVKESGLSKRASRWLTGADKRSASPVVLAQAAAISAGSAISATAANAVDVAKAANKRPNGNRRREAIESVTFAFLGPIAEIVCASAFAESGSLDEVLDRVVSNLPPGEVRSFRNDIAKALNQTSTGNGKASIERHGEAVETIAFAFLGPIAGPICDGVFAKSADLRQAIDELALQLPPSEVENFRKEVAKATGVE